MLCMVLGGDPDLDCLACRLDYSRLARNNNLLMYNIFALFI